MGRIALLNKEVLFLFVICALDTLSSAVLFHGHYAIEANPLLRSFADAGTIPFIIAKSATFLPALLLAFWYGRRRPYQKARSKAGRKVADFAIMKGIVPASAKLRSSGLASIA